MLEQISSGIYLIPRVLTDEHIEKILGIGGLKCHHTDEDAPHGGDSYDEDEKKKTEDKKDKGDDTKKKAQRYRADKPHQLPWVASLIRKQIGRIQLNNLIPHGVDENMQIYNLRQDSGIVVQHIDEDFDGPDGAIALCSILVYLNDDYIGGETLFHASLHFDKVKVGDALLFRHDILHEGLEVKSGEKCVLKTDLFFGK